MDTLRCMSSNCDCVMRPCSKARRTSCPRSSILRAMLVGQVICRSSFVETIISAHAFDCNSFKRARCKNDICELQRVEVVHELRVTKTQRCVVDDNCKL